MGKWLRINLTETGQEIEEIETQKQPRITFICEPREHLHDIYCTLEAVVPEQLKDDITKIWQRRYELDDLELVSALVSIIYEVDDNPYVEMKFDNYELEIKINPD